MNDQNNLTAPLLETDISVEPIAEEGNLPIAKNSTEDDIAVAEADLVESQPDNSTEEQQSWERGEKQPASFRDGLYAVIFYSQFIAVIVLGGIYTKSFLETQGQFANNDDGKDLLHPMTIVRPVLIAAMTAIALVFVALAIMSRVGKSFITCSVWTSAVTSFVLGLIGLSTGMVGFGILCFFSALIGTCYAIRVRNRIPFAAANLSAAISSIKANGGITFIVVLLGTVMFGWMILWTISLFGVIDVQVVCDENEFDSNCSMEAQQGGWILPWILFLFWTQQVFKNIIHTTVAGLVGTWYFSPEEAQSFCSAALGMSLFRSLTYSFGSICLGSLLVAVLQTLDWIVVSLRSQRNRNGNIGASLLLCCLDCILRLLQGMVEYFNKWAFVYVGVYGYPFVTGGKKVMALFEQRGWTVVINDHLIGRALGLMCFIIALVSGIVPLAFATGDGDYVDSPGAFAIGFAIALLLALTIMSIIDSAVSTIIVCFAEAPEEFERNHSAHSRDMKEAWEMVYQIRF